MASQCARIPSHVRSFAFRSFLTPCPSFPASTSHPFISEFPIIPPFFSLPLKLWTHSPFYHPTHIPSRITPSAFVLLDPPSPSFVCSLPTSLCLMYHNLAPLFLRSHSSFLLSTYTSTSQFISHSIPSTNPLPLPATTHSPLPAPTPPSPSGTTR